jgi:hypothetical protein
MPFLWNSRAGASRLKPLPQFLSRRTPPAPLRIPNLESRIPNPESRIPNPKSQISNPGSKASRQPAARRQESATSPARFRQIPAAMRFSSMAHGLLLMGIAR